MKKSITLLICLGLILSLCSCSCFSEVTPTEETKAVSETVSKSEKITETQTETETATETESTTAKKETEKPTEKSTEKPTEKVTEKPTAEEPTYKSAVKHNGIIVVLDAGHDSALHTRNHPNLGVNEQDLNLKITNAAYKRLVQYDGVTVYKSRPDGGCPNSKYGYTYSDRYGDECIHARTEFAESKNADLFVSFHCNASTGSMGASASGTEVYVSKYPKYYSTCKQLGNMILRNITSSLDMKSRGVLTRSKPEKGRYDDGTVKDFYYLISNNVDNKRPAVIIEHAFMDNSHDNAILKNDSNLKKFGVADADAIAQYFGLNLR